MQESFREFFIEMFLLKFRLLEVCGSISFISGSCMSKPMRKCFNNFDLNMLVEFGRIIKRKTKLRCFQISVGKPVEMLKLSEALILMTVTVLVKSSVA